ncbi:MAG TPA: penicillin acylase family protein, partial [Candidatus Eisenbacteria bacterium]
MRRCPIRRALALALLCAGACAPHARREQAPQAGLARSARVLIDHWGVLHVEAHSLPDLYFAWGYATARDRLWQLARLREAADGQLWRWLGNATLRADGGAQLFELRAHAERAWAAQRSDPAAAMPLERYAAGINAYLARCRSGQAPWPAELAALGVQPEDWRPSDSVLLLLGEGVLLDLDLPELAEAQEIAAHGREWAMRRRRFESRWIYDTIPDSAAARLYGGHAAAPAAAQPEARGEPDPALPGLSETRAALEAWRGPGASDPDQRASNVFAVGARRSASGIPLLANDTHLPLGVPGPVHAIHVTVPGRVNAIGFYVPGIPAIVSGRNER